MKKKVINFVSGLDAGGVERLMLEWYRRSKNNIEFDIATVQGGIIQDVLLKEGCKVFKIEPLSECGIYNYIKNAYNIIKKGNYDIVHSHVGVVSGLIFIAAKLVGKNKKILHAHGTKYNSDVNNFFGKIKFNIMRKLSKSLANEYLACSYIAAEYLFGKNLALNKAKIIKNGIDLKKFRYDSNKSRKERFVIGYLARFERTKNHLFLLEVFKEMLFENKKLKLIFMGAGDKTLINDYINKQKIERNVLILDANENVRDFYDLIDVFAFPSRNEGLGIVAIEAQACGVPCVISNGIPSEVMISDIIWQVKLEKDEWIKALKKALRTNKKDVETSIKNNGYDIEDSIKNLLKVYQE